MWHIVGCSQIISKENKATGVYEGACGGGNYNLRLTLDDDGFNKVTGILEIYPNSKLSKGTCGAANVSGKNVYSFGGEHPLSLKIGSWIYYSPKFNESVDIYVRHDGLIEGRLNTKFYKGPVNKAIDIEFSCRNVMLKRMSTSIPKTPKLVYQEKCENRKAK